MFIGQRHTASMSAPVYMQIKWLKGLSRMEKKNRSTTYVCTFFLPEREKALTAIMH